ncbi:hypothetical protein [Candidatus Borreliella tachyglossi]|uniref:hypothetical protein n=1 Tax=Candidatus Borreliella tachyglossi TaxID=1964448 RepID=UPI004043861C
MYKKIINLILYLSILSCTSTSKNIPEIPKINEENLIAIISLETNTNEQEVVNLKKYAEAYLQELLNWLVTTKEIIEKHYPEFKNKMIIEDKQFMEDELKNKPEYYNKHLFIKDDIYEKYKLTEKKSHFIPLMDETSILYSRAESIKNAYDEYLTK